MAVITFLSDYGTGDDFVGVCHGVMARISPETRVIDVTHGVPRHDIRTGALVLRRVLPYFPAGVHLAVVDPEVGASRRAVAIRCTDENRLLVGPDNGLLSLAAQRFGGIAEAVDLERSVLRLEPVSATFHGRDIFSPVAAHLAAGVDLGAAGDPIDPRDVRTLDMPLARIEGDTLFAHAVVEDRFGNVALDIEHEELAMTGLRLGHRATVEVGGVEHSAFYAVTFADVAEGELLLYEDAYRTFALAVNRGSAAQRLRLEPDAEIRVRQAP
jgi:S-adenosyl-L-methionine hydrolase (adenosine-forming)